jgi:glucose-6-phosphate 1-dehydrogenase
MPTVFVAFGVTGDLMRLKILHDLFALHQKGDLPEQFDIIGVSRKSWDDAQLREYVRGVLSEKNETARRVESFLNRCTFAQGDVGDEALFAKLSETIGAREAILYISLSPALYAGAFEKLARSPLAGRADTVRLMIEKPYGRSGEEARELDRLLHGAFSEERIYRVDHYGAKESLMHLPTPDESRLARIVITFLQQEGVEQRAEFYEATGALRDVGQNHMLMMLASALRPERRAEAVAALAQLSPEDIGERTTRAQWDGYRAISGVAPDSPIETYFNIETFWGRIPLVLQGGKYMGEDRKEIMLEYQDSSQERHRVENNTGRSEHEILILDCVAGVRARFVSSDEIAAQWRFTDPILERWGQGIPELKTYARGASLL